MTCTAASRRCARQSSSCARASTAGASTSTRRTGELDLREDLTVSHRELLGDRVDSFGSSVTSVLRLHPDNPVSETGILGELHAGPVRSRVGRGRTDLEHQWIDPVIVSTPWVVRGVVVALAVRGLRRRL